MKLREGKMPSSLDEGSQRAVLLASTGPTICEAHTAPFVQRAEDMDVVIWYRLPVLSSARHFELMHQTGVDSPTHRTAVPGSRGLWPTSVVGSQFPTMLLALWW